jgi:DNA-binding MarR family transcriptional regulator
MDKHNKLGPGRKQGRQQVQPQARQAQQAQQANDFWHVLTEFAFSLRGWWIALCAELDLTPAQGQALRTLDPDRPVAMNTLADNLFCDASNVTGIIDKLETRGLIARQGAERDRRIKMLVVTPEGRELRARLFARAAEPPPAVAALPADVRRRLATVLRAVLDERGSGPAAAHG